MAAYLERDSGFFTRRSMVVFAILGLHVLIAWALATGLARRAMEIIAPPIQTVIETEKVKETPPPPPPPPTFERPPVEIPPSDTTIEVPVAALTTAISNTTTQHVAPAPPAAHTKSALGPGKGFPNSDEYYPPASRRLEEQGMAIVAVCVGPDGKLTQTPTIAKSSGSPRLDEGAIKLTTAASGRYKPATEDGKAISACSQLGIRFQLK